MYSLRSNRILPQQRMPAMQRRRLPIRGVKKQRNGSLNSYPCYRRTLYMFTEQLRIARITTAPCLVRLYLASCRGANLAVSVGFSSLTELPRNSYNHSLSLEA